MSQSGTIVPTGTTSRFRYSVDGGAQQPDAKQPSEPPKKKKKKKAAPAGAVPEPSPSEAPKARSYSPPAGPFLSFGMIPARAPLPAAWSVDGAGTSM